MKKFSFFLFFVLLLGVSSCGQDHSIVGNISHYPGTDSMIVKSTIISTSTQQLDTLFIKNGNFQYDLTFEEPVWITFYPYAAIRTGTDGISRVLMTNKTMTVLWFPGEQLKITGEMEPDYLSYQVSGSAFSQEESQFRLNQKDLMLQIDRLQSQLDSLASVGAPDSLVSKLYIQGLQVVQFLEEKQMDYIRTHDFSDLSAYLLLQQPLDTFILYYERFEEKAKASAFGKVLENSYMRGLSQKALAQPRRIESGSPALDFTLPDLKGNNVTLSSLKGKYLVLDFWGSWCIWCMKGIPQMTSYYAKYKDKVEFVGVACNDNEDDWKKAISEHNLQWTQLFFSGDGINIPALYNISGFPTKIIIDPDFNIVGIFSGESNEFYQKLDELLQ